MTPQELKNSILQLAIQGKLVEQRAEEGTAEELYKQIQEEKQRLIAEKKIKKEKSLPEITEDEKPFDIPDSWKYIKFGDICKLLNGEKIKAGNLPYLEAKYLRGKSEPKILNEGKFIKRGTKVILVDGENSGEVFEINEDGYMGSTFKILFIPSNIYLKYVLSFLEFYKNILKNNKKGAAIPHLNKEIFFNLAFPLPPLEEQKRIVAKIEELLPYIDRYEKSWSKLETFNKRFPDDMKKSLLQYAIQGKLVEQRQEEGTAEELFEKIQAEKQRLIDEKKIKKQKPLPEITDDEIPFDIPDSWKWVHFNDIASSNLGKTLDKVKNTGDFKPYLCSINVYWEGIKLDKVKEARFEEAELSKYILQKGDLLICEGGDVGRSCVWNEDITMYYQNALHRIRFYKNINPYFYKFLIECYKSIGIIDKFSKGVTIKHLVQSSLNAMWIPLPPLEEQKRIVEKLEQLLPLCERLK